MIKSEVGQILILVKSGAQEALNMKIYRNGLLCRRGCGGLPEIAISGMSFTDQAAIFDALLSKVPDELLENPIQYQDEKITEPLEYIIAFYGVSKNGETGEYAEWTKSTGVRLLLDSNTTFRHPILGFADSFSTAAADQTNSWYFDIMVNAIYGYRADTLPAQSIITAPNTEAEKWETFSNYVNQIRTSARKWDIQSFAAGKTYKDGDDKMLKCTIQMQRNSAQVNFLPIDEGAGPNEEQDKKWWKFW